MIGALIRLLFDVQAFRQKRLARRRLGKAAVRLTGGVGFVARDAQSIARGRFGRRLARRFVRRWR